MTKRGFGYADLATKEPVDPDRHLFRPGSVSKLFTWTAVMQLVEQGKLDLHAPITDYIDQFPIPNEFDTPMTMVHLMTHAPGLEDGAAGYLFSDDPADSRPLYWVLFDSKRLLAVFVVTFGRPGEFTVESVLIVVAVRHYCEP